VAKLTSDQRAELEAEREFLVRSLDDLDAERAEGAMDETTYATLHSDYTARTATVLRTLESGTAPETPKAPPIPKGRRFLVVGAIIVFAGVAAFALTRSSGTRASGGLPSGGVTTPTVAPNSYEGHLAAAERFRAEDIPDQATKEYLAAARLRPQSAEPLTDLAEMLLTRYANGLDNNPELVTEAGTLIDHALRLEPNYAQAYLYRGIVARAQNKPVAQSIADFKHYLQLAPNGPQAAMANSLISQLTAPSTSTTTPGAATTTSP
jgi:hypothetical protein